MMETVSGSIYLPVLTNSVAGLNDLLLMCLRGMNPGLPAAEAGWSPVQRTEWGKSWEQRGVLKQLGCKIIPGAGAWPRARAAVVTVALGCGLDGDSSPQGLPGDKQEFLSWETPSSHFNLGWAMESLLHKRLDCLHPSNVISPCCRRQCHVPQLQES